MIFLLLLILPDPLRKSDPVNRLTMMAFSATYGTIYVYLMLPVLERLFKKYYMPSALLAASVLPIAIINFKYRYLLETGTPVTGTSDTMIVTLLLLFPLILTAWQYSFPIVFLFYVVLGFLDPILIVLVNERLTPEIYGAFNASLIRILTLSAVGFIITELRERQRLEQSALEEANRRLAEFTDSKERLATSRERNRIARDIHDTLAHTLSGLAIQLEAINTVCDAGNNDLRIMVDKASQTVHDGLESTRRALKALHSTPVEDIGLLPALMQLGDDAQARSTITVETKLHIDFQQWGKGLLETIYRIAQEALGNTVRHTNASHAVLELRGNQTQLRLTITDNGGGFLPDYTPRDDQFGLRGMKERAHSVKGRLSVHTEIEKGTTILFEWEAIGNDKNHDL